MSKDQPDIIIVRRSAGRIADQPKTGVWKIAHADFMTAMMALFLVLWLVNSTNRETRSRVAQYFNPIRLSDTTADRKGVRNPQDADPGEAEHAIRHEGHEIGAAGSGSERRPSIPARDPRQGAAGFEDPYAVLAEVAASKAEPRTDKALPQPLAATGAPGVRGDEVPRDPFDPNFWRQALQGDPATKPDTRAVATVPPTTAPPAPQPVPQPAPVASALRRTEPETAPVLAQAKEAGAEPPGAVATSGPAALPMTPRSIARPEPALSVKPGAEQTPADTAVARAIAAAISGGKEDSQRRDSPQVDVRQTDEGLLISLTDDANFGMFAIGSADPHQETVKAMQRIASVLNKREGAIIIRGHTDGRLFRGRQNDNWRLSTARAHAAQDLLIQGGIDEARIEHVEGYASRKPRAADPNAAENRRIEILVREKRA
jgi:chemotaxis protein MotB